MTFELPDSISDPQKNCWWVYSHANKIKLECLPMFGHCDASTLKSLVQGSVPAEEYEVWLSGLSSKNGNMKKNKLRRS